MFIVGIEPGAPGLHVFKKIYIPRLGLPRLLTMAEERGHRCEIYCEDAAPISWDRVAKADLVLISSITSTVPRAYKIIKKIKEINIKKAPILIGGPHVTFLPEEALEAGADYIFRHGADDSFMQWLEWYCSDRDSSRLHKIPGLSFKVGSEYHHSERPAIVDLDSLPTPNLKLIQGYKPVIIPLLTSEGCPFNCEFCSEREMHGTKYRYRSVAKVITDLNRIVSQYGRNIHVFLVDDNAGASRRRLRELCQAIIDNDLVLDYSAQIRIDLPKKDPGLLALMRQAGFSRLYIGYETTNQASLDEAHKGINYEDMVQCTKLIHSYGFAIHCMMVFGFDHDTLKTIKDNSIFIVKLRMETSQTLILVPIPGARLFERLKKEGRIINTDWSKYDGNYVTFRPKNIAARQLQVVVMLKHLPKLYNLFLTLQIFLLNNIQILSRLLRGRKFYPRKEFKTSLATLAFRIWGFQATRRIRKNIRDYLERRNIWQRAEE